MAFGRRKKSGLTTGALSDYRTEDASAGGRQTVNVDAAARGLGVSKKAVRDVIRKSKAKFSDRVLRSLTGRVDADRSDEASPKGLLQAVFGRGARGGAVNAKAAADTLGVSQGTVRRWAAGTQKPSDEHLSSLRTAARRVTSTKRGRKAAADEFRKSALGKASERGSTIYVSVYGYQGPVKESQTYWRDRTIYQPLDTTDVQAMLRAYEEDGDDGFQRWLTDRGNDYMNEGRYHGVDDIWDFADIHDIKFEERP